MTIAYLKKYKRVYLASPYTLFRRGPSAAYTEVAALAAKLMREDICVFSPIVHGHTIALLGHLDFFDEGFWAYQNKGHQDGCDALVIAKMDGWHESAGITGEFAHAHLRNQPVYYLDPETLLLTTST